MTDFSNYAENAIGNHLLRNVAMSSPAVVYLGLFTAVTDVEAGTGTEVTTVGTGYIRQAITFGAPTDGVFLNSVQVAFATATANYGTVTHTAIFDAVSGGNPITAIKALPTPRIINSGDTMQFPVGNISATFA